jgi:hypothetical protein
MTQTQFDVRGQDYSRNLLPLARQEDSMLYPCVYVKTGVTGKSFYQDQIGNWEMTEQTAVNAATPQNDPNLSRTRIDVKTFADARMVDPNLELQAFADPLSEQSVCVRSAVGITIDKVIYNALGGTALRGETGATAVTFPSSQTVKKDFEVSGTNSGLTIAKIREAGRKMDAAAVPPRDRYIVASATGKSQLLGADKATNIDYTNGKPLATGTIPNFYGFTLVFLPDGIISKTSNIANYFAFQRTGLCFAMWENLFLRVEDRSDLSYSKQVFYRINCGAARLEEAKVVKIEGDESVIV